MARQAACRSKEKKEDETVSGWKRLNRGLSVFWSAEAISKWKPGIEEFSSCVVSKALSRGSACISSSSLIGWCIFLFS